MTRSLKCLFSGKTASAVPGMDFKEWIQTEAKNLSITGWVRNLHDDRIEVLAQGSEENLKELHIRLLQGPPLSQVDNLECEWINYEKAYATFELRS